MKRCLLYTLCDGAFLILGLNTMVLALESTSTVASIKAETGMTEPLTIFLAVFNFIVFFVAVVGNSLVLFGECFSLLIVSELQDAKMILLKSCVL